MGVRPGTPFLIAAAPRNLSAVARAHRPRKVTGGNKHATRPGGLPPQRLNPGLVLAVTTALVLAFVPVVATTSVRDSLHAPKQALLLLSAAAILPLLPWSKSFPRPLVVAVLSAFVVWLGAVSLLGQYPRESILGWYGFRIGWLTWLLAGVVLLAAAAGSGEQLGRRLIAGGGATGAVLAALLALAQETNASDAITALRFSGRVSGLAGSPNTLAAVLLVGVGYLALLKLRPGLLIPSVALLVFGTWLSLSRTGVAAMILLVLAAAALTFLLRRAELRAAVAWPAALLLGTLLALPSGAVAETTGRVTGAPVSTVDSDLGYAADLRTELWEAGARVAAARPLIGFGADTLPFVYGTYRQSSPTLDEYYTRNVSSAHNLVLDTAIAGGIPAVAALALVGGAILAPAIRRGIAEPQILVVSVAALAALGTLMFNPLEIGILVPLAGLLGLLAPTSRPNLPQSLRTVATSLGFAAAIPLVVLAVLLLRADAIAKDQRQAYLQRDYETAYHLARRAADLLPLERRYQFDAFLAAFAAAATTGTPDSTRRAADAGTRLHQRFAPLAPELLARARLEYLQDPANPLIDELLATILRLQPNSPRWAADVADVRR